MNIGCNKYQIVSTLIPCLLWRCVPMLKYKQLAVCVLAALILGAGSRSFADEKAEDANPDVASRIKLPRSSTKFPLRQPPCPPGMKDKGGVVGLVLLVDETGRPTKVVVGKSSGYTEFDEAAKSVLGTWRLQPGTIDGVPTPMWSCYAITFNGHLYERTEKEQQSAAAYQELCAGVTRELKEAVAAKEVPNK